MSEQTTEFDLAAFAAAGWADYVFRLRVDDGRLTVTHLSGRLAALTPRAADGLDDWADLELDAADGSQSAFAAHVERLRAGRASACEYALAAHGRVEWIAERAAPVNGAAEIVGSGRVITKERQDRLDADRLHGLLSATEDALWEWDRTTDALYLSPGYAKMLGYPPGDEPRTMAEWRKLLHPEDEPQIDAAVARHVAHPYLPIWLELRIAAVEGWRWVLLRGKATAWFDGAPAKLVGTLGDVTHRKCTEAALRASEQRLELIMRWSSDGINICEFDRATGRRRLVLCNERYVEMSGRARESLYAAANLDDFVEYPDEATMGAEWHRRRAEGLAYSGRASWKRPDGRENYYEWTAAPAAVEGKLYIVGVDRDVTERLATEAALQASEARYRAIVETQSELIARHLPDTTLLFVNDEYCRFFGRSAEELLGQRFIENVEPERRAEVEAILAELTPAQPVRTTEFRLPNAAGEMRWVEWTDAAFFDAFGNLIERQSVGRDITERKQTEQTLRETQRRLDLALETGHMGYWRWDMRTHAVEWFGEHAALFGLSPDEFRGTLEHVQEIVHPDDRAQGVANLERALADRAPFDNVYRIVRPHSGEVRWMHSFGRLIENEQGEVAHIFGVTQDITHEKNAELELRASEARYRAIVDLQRELIARYLPDTTLTFVNDEYVRFFGQSREELIGRSFLYALDSRYHDAVKRYIADIPHCEGRPAIEVLNRNAAGELRWIEWSDHPIFDDAGEIIEIQSVGRDVTERKRMEEALAASEARYRSLVETQTELIVRVDRTGHLSFVNEACCAMLGRPRETLLGQPAETLLELSQSVASAADSAAEHARSEQWLDTPAGRRCIAWKVRAIPHGDESPDELQAVGRDITEQCRAAELLSIQRDLGVALSAVGETEAAFEHVLDAVCRIEHVDCAAVYSLDADDGSFRMAAQRGLSAQFMSGVRDVPLDTPEAQLALAGAPTYSPRDDYRVASKDRRDSEGMRAVACVPILGGERVVAALNLASRTCDEFPELTRDAIEAVGNRVGPVIERVMARRALSASESRYRLLAENAADLISRHSAEGTFLYASPSSLRLLGYRPDELVGQSGFMVAHSQDVDFLRKAYERYLGAPSDQVVEFRARTKDGRGIWLEIAVRPVFDERGALAESIVVSRDITRRKDVESQLLQAQKMEAVGQLAAGVAHDFNNLISAIFGYADTAKRDLPDAHPARGALANVVEAATQAAGMTRTLLAFSRKASLERAPVSLRRMVEQSARLMRRLLPKSIQLITATDARPTPWVEADAAMLQQMLTNLIINARDAMPKGGMLRLAVDWADATDPTPFGAATGEPVARLRVSDTGCGIAPEVQQRIFEPFFSTKPAGQGAGLGLAIAQFAVHAHGGRIAVASSSSGSTFTIWLPSCPPATHAETPALEPPTAGRGELILVAVAARQVREIIASQLRGLNYEVAIADSGPAALEAYQRQRGEVRMLILDADLRERGGLELLNDIRAQGEDAPMLLIAGELDPQREDELDEVDALVLRKPFQMPELASLVSGVLRAAQTGDCE